CAAPIVLAEANLISKKRITAHPSVKERLINAVYTGSMTEIDGNTITGKGPGAAVEFSLKIATALGVERDAKTLIKQMFF
ncbi:MAG: DJ-1/PfpI family protein, partial [Verrucomicrobiota bacterium]|nr:DJ-1/PfpI family protein [Verrucomicrobiota bacterium]